MEEIELPKINHSDLLLECLHFLTKYHGRPVTHEALKSGLPSVNGMFTPSIFIRAANRIGFTTRIIKRDLDKISSMVLPVVLILKNMSACILLQRLDNSHVEIMVPESGGSKKISLDELNEHYTGVAILAQPKIEFEHRSDEFELQTPEHWFWGTLLKYRHHYYHVIIAAFLINIFTSISPLYAMNVYDRVIPNNAQETLWVLSSGILITYIFYFLLRILRAYIIDINGKKIDTELGSKLLSHVLGMRMEKKPASAGAFSNQMAGYESLRDLFTSATFTALIDFPFIFIFFWIIWLIGGSIVITPFVGLLVVILSTLLLHGPARKAVEESHVGVTQKHSIIVESITGLETIKAFSAEGQILSRWEKFTTMIAEAGLKSKFYSALAVDIATLVTQIVSVVMIVHGVYLIMDNELSMGALIACNILGGRALAPIGQIAAVISRYQQGKISLANLNHIMNLDPERPFGKQFLNREKIQGAIQFENVCFSYPDQKIASLNQVSFKISPGEKVALLGKIGSGKSTIIKLILGLYQPQKGTILIDDVDISQIDPADLRRNIGFVGQNNLLFYGTVRTNISFGAPWADDQSIFKVGAIAGVEHFTKKHPSGYDMRVGERGDGLSGGQAQTVAIARALLTNPPILLMDEPTSSMDNQAVSELINSLSQVTKDKTLIVVTHKIPVLALVNRIIILENGRIVADGPKEDVLQMLAGNQ